MNNTMNQFMAIHTDDERNGDILGKYMYYSLPKLIIKAERVREICEQIGFPVTVNENISVTDAFRSATGEIHDRIEEPYGSEIKVCRIYCRDNKRVGADVLSRELVEETLYETHQQMSSSDACRSRLCVCARPERLHDAGVRHVHRKDGYERGGGHLYDHLFGRFDGYLYRHQRNKRSRRSECRHFRHLRGLQRADERSRSDL